MVANKRMSARTLKNIVMSMGPDVIVAISPAESAGQFSACASSLRLSLSEQFRADEAPELPLRDCSYPDRCMCVYSVQVNLP